MSQQAMRQFSTEFKQSTVLRLEAGERLAAVADELKIKRKLLYEWRAAWRKLGVAGLNRKRGPKRGFLAARASPDGAPGPDAPSELARLGTHCELPQTRCHAQRNSERGAPGGRKSVE